MQSAEHLRIQYDSMSKTVLVQKGVNSLVLIERFDNRGSAEQAARRFAEKYWDHETKQ